MKEIKYISPTGLKLYMTDPDAFYQNYLADVRPEREPQNQPMSIGSAFDAYVKNHLYESLFGKNHDPKYALQTIFEAQVEPQWRTWALEHGRYVFEQYKQCGALADLMLELTQASGTPRFEFEVMGAVSGYREGVERVLGSVTFLGKPDVHYVNASGQSVILDFKVNGYLSKHAYSPLNGYLRLRSAGQTQHGMHKKCVPMRVNGMMINVAEYLDNIQEDWAAQLSIYAWLLGEPVGSQFIVAIDQVVCNATTGAPLPQIRIAEHRLRVSPAYQQKLFAYASNVWEVARSDHFFRELSLEESKARCELLDSMTKQPIDPAFERMMR